jgi:hypothetical protein
MQDRSPDAVTPALGYAANVITVTTILFFAMVMFIFWLGGLTERGHAAAARGHAAPTPEPVAIAGGSARGASTTGDPRRERD